MTRRYGKDRDFSSNPYKEWKRKVHKRDKCKCKFPNCKNRGYEAHHIMPWSKFPSLRYVVSNGITLCHKCHQKIRKKEHIYAPMFKFIIERGL